MTIGRCAPIATRPNNNNNIINSSFILLLLLPNLGQCDLLYGSKLPAEKNGVNRNFEAFFNRHFGVRSGFISRPRSAHARLQSACVHRL